MDKSTKMGSREVVIFQPEDISRFVKNLRPEVHMLELILESYNGLLDGHLRVLPYAALKNTGDDPIEYAGVLFGISNNSLGSAVFERYHSSMLAAANRLRAELKDLKGEFRGLKIKDLSDEQLKAMMEMFYPGDFTEMLQLLGPVRKFYLNLHPDASERIVLPHLAERGYTIKTVNVGT